MDNIFKVLILIIFIILPVNAVEYARIDYSGIPVDYTKINEEDLTISAQINMRAWQASKEPQKRNKYLQRAMGDYYILTKINPRKVSNFVNLAILYDEIGNNILAKEYLYKATNINPNNPQANFYFGEYYYKRKDYNKAIKMYQNALNNGFQNNYILNLHIASTYEKMSDLRNAQIYYKKVIKINPSEEIVNQKIRTIEDYILSHPKYYNFSGD